MWEKLKKILLFSAELMDTVCTALLFALMLGSSLLLSLGYYLDAICGFLAVIALATISAYLDLKRINTQLKTWLEKHNETR